MTLSLLIQKFQSYAGLDDDDRRAISKLPVQTRRVAPRSTVLRYGEKPETSLLILAGCMVRQRNTSESTQILSLHLPADMPDLHSLYLNVMDHDLVSLNACELGFISHINLRRMLTERPRVRDALWHESQIDAGHSRSLLLNIGQRNAAQRVAHWFLEVSERVARLGLNPDDFGLPMTQSQLANTLGITDVHANRILRGLAPMVIFRHYVVQIVNRAALVTFAGYDRDSSASVG